MACCSALDIESIHKTTVFGIIYNKIRMPQSPQSSDPEPEPGDDGRRLRRRRCCCCCCGRRRRPDVGLDDLCIPFPRFVPLPVACSAASPLSSPLPLAVDVDGLGLGVDDGNTAALATGECGEFDNGRLTG